MAVATGTESVNSQPEGVTLGATLAQDVLLVVASLLAVKLYEGGVRPDWFGLRTHAVLARGRRLRGDDGRPGGSSHCSCCSILGQPPDQELVAELKSERSELVLAAFGVLVCVFAPICEELFFRGLMFRVFADRVGIVAGAALSGAIFGLVHLPGSPLVTGVVLFGLGFGFALLRWWTGSLLPPMALHAINNSLLVRR